MAKRTKKAKASRSNLRVEALEQRQLLATIVAGSGVEVASNVSLKGGIYDQILMTGASVTVMADPGEVVRVSFLDQGGDIVQAEFAGKGTMTVSLEDVRTAGSAGYVNKAPAQTLNGAPINYVQGLASITIDKPQLDTNLGVYAAGIVQNPGLFTGAANQGDNGMADIARVVLVGDPTNGAGYSNMGGLRLGGAQFSASTGVVGIRGENVAVHDIVAIGDIDAKESGVPTLMFNSNSQFQTVFVRGGDLRQSNGASFDTFGNGQGGAPGGSPGNGNNITLGGFSFFNSTDNVTSQNTYQWSAPVNQAAIRLAAVDQQTIMGGDWVYDWTNPQDVKVSRNGVDVSAGFGGNWLAKGGIQASLDWAFERRTFGGNVTIKGDLPAGFELNMADARGNVTFENNLFGLYTVNGFGAGIDGTLTVKGNLDGSVIVQGLDRTGAILNPFGANGGGFDGQQNKINALLVEGSTGPFTDVRAEDIGNVTIYGNMSGYIGTDVTRGNAWSTFPGQKTATGYVDVEGFLGNISVGFNAAGASTGGSIVNGTFQGNSGIGNIRVGGDIWGTPQNQAVFQTVSNAGAAPTDVRNYGSANIGTIDVRGDVDLDSSSDRLIFINGNGTFGNINVQGLTTTNTVPGPQIGTKTALIPGSEAFVRILSPFTDVGFKLDSSKGQALIQNYDPDGVAGPLNDTYFVTKSDVAAGAMIYDIATGKMVNAKEGDRVPALSGGAPIIDTFGNVLYRQNTALFEGKTQTVPIFGPDVVTVISGNRGSLDGVFNNFGRIEIAGLLGAQQKTTGNISWTDSVDMNFGGITVNSSGAANQGVIGTVGTIGQITINNTSGATSDIIFSGVMGSANSGVAGNNGGTAMVGLQGLTVTGFEDVRFAGISVVPALNNIIHATEVKNGVSVTTVAGSGNGQGAGTVSPSINFDSRIQLDNGTSELSQGALLSLNTGMTNSTISFNNASGIVVDDGATTGNGSAINPISLSADYVNFAGTLSARTIGALTLTGGKGIGSTTDTGVSFTGNLAGNTIGAITGSANEGNVVFAPASLNGISTLGTVQGVTPVANVASITLTTAGNNNGGDIRLAPAAATTYNANIGDITLTAGHKLFLNQAGTVIDNPGNIDINLITTGNVGNVAATTTTGNIANVLTIQGNVGNITYTAGAAAVTNADVYAGAVGDLARWGNISAAQTIWGTRGVTTMETAGQKADGTAATLDFTVNSVNYKLLPAGTINATVNYAGASTAAASADAFIAKTGAGTATVNYNIIGNDDNADGVLAATEIGHGGNANVSSISGSITFAGRTQLTDYTHFSTLGNVALKTGTYAQASGLLLPDLPGTPRGQIGDINLSFGTLGAAALGNIAVGATGGFEGAVGNVSATTTGGDITFAQSRFDGKVGNVTLSSGAVAHTGGVAVGDISTTGTGVTFNGGQGLVKTSVTDIGTINTTYSANSPLSATGNGFEFTAQYGVTNATIAAGSYDYNNNKLVTADEYGRTGDLSFVSAGGALNITLNSNAYASDLEQSGIGNVTATNTAYYDVKNGATDVLGIGTSPLGSAIAAAGGNITITGANTQVGAVGNLLATTNVGTIVHTGLFGDLGTATFTTSSYSDVDTNPNTTTEAAVLLNSGNVQLGTGFNVAKGNALQVNGKHGLATYTVVEDGAINGTVYYGGMATSASSLVTSSARGNTSLAIWLQDADRDGSGLITANEYGTHGSASLTTTSGGDITLALGTDQNNAAVLARNLVPQLTFGNVTATAADRYTSTSATAADALADAGNITFTAVGADATNAAAFGPVTGHRGVVGNLTANTTRGAIAMTGNWGAVGDQAYTVTRYLDVNGANTNTFAGTINYSPSIWGTHGTATLRTTDSGFVGSGTPAGGGITGVANFGGALASGKTVSVDAKTERANIALDVFARGYDINGDGKVTDGVSNNIPGDVEFAKVGNLILETTNAGDITLGLGIATADGSKIGSSIGNVSVTANDDLYTAVANAADTVVNLANATVQGKSALPLLAGTVGDIAIAVNTGTANLSGNFVNIGGVGITTGTYTDASNNAGGTSAVQAAGNIQLGTQAYSATTNADLTLFSSLNIAGSYNDSSLSVQEMGTITGAVYVAGSGGKNWNLTSNYGAINVGYIAGFDADGKDIGGKFPGEAGYTVTTGEISSTEAGTIGNLTATSTRGAVTLGVGGRASGSVVGNVSVATGDGVTVNAGANDTFASGNATITGVSGSGLGSVGNLTNSVKTGIATLNGRFGALGNATYTTDAYVDVDTVAAAGEEALLLKSGDIALNAQIWGAHGTLNLTTVDSSKLAAGKSALLAALPLAADLGTITGSVAFSGGLASGVTAGIVGRTDRGAINIDVVAGIDEADVLDVATSPAIDKAYASGEAGTVGTIGLTSTDGNITLTLDIANTGSSIGAVTLSTGSTYETKAEAADLGPRAAGSITIDSSLAQNFGTLGAVNATTVSGNISMIGSYFNTNTVNLTAGTYADLDTAVGAGEAPVVLASGNITATLTALGTHGTVTLSTVDSRADVTSGGTITANLTVGGTNAAAQSLVATTESGALTGNVSAVVNQIAADHNGSGVFGSGSTVAVPVPLTYTGVAKDVALTSTAGAISSTLTTEFVSSSTAADRVGVIGNVLAETGSLFTANAAAVDVAAFTGNVTLTGASVGQIGNITGRVATGLATLTGNFSRTVGNIELTAGAYSDGDTAVGAGEASVVIAAGSVSYTPSYGFGSYDPNKAPTGIGAIAPTTIGSVTLRAGGNTTPSGVVPGVAGNITDGSLFHGSWYDFDAGNDVDANELAVFTSTGAYLAEVTDGSITYGPNSTGGLANIDGGAPGPVAQAGFGAKLDNVTLRTTGANAGAITINAQGDYSQVSNFTATAAVGNIIQNNSLLAPAITDVTLRATTGSVTMNGSLLLDFANATNNKTTNVALSGLTLDAGNGNVTIAGVIGENINYGAANLLPTGTSDSRIATLSKVSISASNGAADAGAADGRIIVTGTIGGADITSILDSGNTPGLAFSASNVSGDGSSLNSGAVTAHDIGTVSFSGNVNLNGAGAISASDAATTRTRIGSVDYSAMTTGTAANKGANLDTIQKIVVTNGSITGAAGVTYAGSNRGEIEASYIGALEFINNSNPSVGPGYTVSDLDVLASNSRGGVSQGEFLNVTGVNAADGAHAITKFGIGNVRIEFNVVNTDNAGALFAGNSAFVGLGGIGQSEAGSLTGGIRLTTSTNGAVPRPMFGAATGEGVRFAAGSGIAYGNTFDLDGDTATAAAAYDAIAATGDKISVGDIFVKVGRADPLVPTDPLMANIGGGAGVATDGFGVLVGVQAPAAGLLATRVAAATELFGYIKSVDVSTTTTRENADGTAFAAVGGAAVPAGGAASGAFIAVAGDNLAAVDIGNLDNDFVPNGDAPVSDGQGLILGDTDAAYEAGEVIVYVL